MKNVLVVYNPNAGRKQSVRLKKKITDFLCSRGCSFKMFPVNELAESFTGNYDSLIVIGGDGTVNKAAVYCIGKDIPLGIVPAGTANLFAEKLGIKSNIKKTISVLVKQNIKACDVLKINDKYSVLRAGFGYDSDIICKTPQSLKNKFGYFAYFIAGILFALRLKKRSYKLTLDSNNIEISASCLIIANCSNMYKNYAQVGKSDVQDGIFEIFIMDIINPFVFFGEFLKIVFNINKDNKSVKFLHAKRLEIENEFITCHIDGEKIKLKGNIVIETLPFALKVFKPPAKD